MQNNQPLTKKERKELRRQERTLESAKTTKSRQTKKWAKTALVFLVIVGGVAGLWWWASSQPERTPSTVISTGGIHWHTRLSITILGDEREIPANIGIGAVHNPVHTHDPDGIIHLEFSSRVTEDNVRLGEFFRIWGKTFNRDCIFDFCGGEKGKVRLSVNGEPNFDFENYVMRDGDKIEIIFE